MTLAGRLAGLVPPALVAGDSWQIADAVSAAEYPPADWVVTWLIRPLSGGAPVTAEVIDGVARFAAAITAPVAAGPAEWVAVAEGRAGGSADGERVTLARGQLTIAADPLAGAYAPSAAERILAAIDATLEGRVTRDAESYSIEGRSLSRTPVEDLRRLRGFYARMVREERGESGIVYRRVDLC